MAAPPFPYSSLGSGRVVTNPRTNIPQALFRTDSGIAISRRRATGISHYMSMVYVVNCEQRTFLEWHFDQSQGEMFEWQHRHVVGVVNARYIGDEIQFTETGAESDGSPIYEAQFEIEIIAPSRYTIRDICIEGGGSGGGGIIPPPDPNPNYLYLAKDTAAFGSPAFATEWNETGSGVRRKLLRPEQIEFDGNGLSEILFPECESPAFEESWLLGQFITDPLAEQTLSGSVKGQLQFLDEILASAGMVVQVIIRIVSGVGVHKGNLINWIGETTLVDPYTNRFAPYLVELSGGGDVDTGELIEVNPLEIDEGDRIVVEYGVRNISEDPGGGSFVGIQPSCAESVLVRENDGSLWIGGDFGTATLSEIISSDVLKACTAKASANTGLYIDISGQLFGIGSANGGGGSTGSIFGNGINSGTAGSWVSTFGGNDLPNFGTGVLGLFANAGTAFVIDADKKLYHMGDGGGSFFPQFSYRGDGSTSDTLTPLEVLTNAEEVTMAAGGPMVRLTDGTVKVSGQGGGWMGANTTTNQTSWLTSTITDVAKIRRRPNTGGGGDVSFAILEDGTVKVCGNNSSNHLGDIGLGSGDVLTWRDLDLSLGVGELIEDIAVCIEGAAALTSFGRVLAWGNAYAAGQGETSGNHDPAEVLTDCKGIGASQGALFAVKLDNTVMAWGAGSNFQRGDNSTTSLDTPTLMPWSVGVCFNQFQGMKRGSKVSGVTTTLPEDETNTDVNKVPWIYFEDGVIFAS